MLTSSYHPNACSPVPYAALQCLHVFKYCTDISSERSSSLFLFVSVIFFLFLLCRAAGALDGAHVWRMARLGRGVGHGDVGEVVLADGFDGPGVCGWEWSVFLPSSGLHCRCCPSSSRFCAFFSAPSMFCVDGWRDAWTYRLRRRSLGYIRRSRHYGQGMAGEHDRERRRVCCGSRSRRIGGFYRALGRISCWSLSES